MTGDRTARLRLVPTSVADPVTRILADLPPQWHSTVIGPGIGNWESMAEAGRGRAVHLHGVPERLRNELAWMAHWQHRDGMKVAVDVVNQFASVLAWAAESEYPLPHSLAWVEKTELLRLHGIWFHHQHGRLPAADKGRRARLERLLGYPRLALTARLHDGIWWEMDTWHPRCDPRIPLREREPCRSVGCSPGAARLPWVRNAIKWHLGTLLEAGTITWSTLTGQRSPALLRFARWLEILDDPAEAIRDAAQAGSFAAAFRRWACEPGHRSSVNRPPEKVSTNKVNLDVWAIAELMTLLIDHRHEAAQVLGPSPWDELTEAHPAIWLRQRTRLRRHQPVADETHYVDDHALAQITTCLPVLAEPSTRTTTVTRDGLVHELPGQDDPQLMRMLLLQILTGRRASEICLCTFDCLSPATAAAVQAAEGEAVARFHYGQSKIDEAPDNILIDAEAVAIIEEQRQWLRERFPEGAPPHLFPQKRANAHGTKPYGNSNYGRALGLFSDLTQITDAAGRPIRLSHTHRFRHTKLTKLAELGLPVHVLQRYAGHSTPTMSMHYVARREEHAEQAFLATRKFKADGTRVVFSQEDHDSLHLLDRADRFLPNGYCLLPPLQKCEKGNACLTCGVFVTDDSHLDILERQLAETTTLMERNTTRFQQRHGRPMPDDNVWLLQRRAEREALVKLLGAMRANLGRAIQGAGSPSTPTPVSIDLTRHRKPQP
ncbi:tyrosine-type recombinase/integrase (plasmid) [Streptomyces sp. NBC_01384]|uniref:tyrosine-type recombinase/integrase n=1 Tax=Streptomyces sp. NBC_01384 TaxID=2903847 RepID=UPI002F90E100